MSQPATIQQLIDGQVVTLTASEQIPGFALYAGATITRAVDGSGAEYIACCATDLALDRFGFHVFRNGVNVPLQVFCPDRRGSIAKDDSDGLIHWIAWPTPSSYATDVVPGCVPISAPPAVVTEGGYTQAPRGAVRVFKHADAAAPFSGVRTVDLGAFGIPATATQLQLRIAIYDRQAGQFGRAGPPDPITGEPSTGAMLCVVTQAPSVWNYIEGWRAPGPGNTLIVMADQGAIDQLIVDVIGWVE